MGKFTLKNRSFAVMLVLFTILSFSSIANLAFHLSELNLSRNSFKLMSDTILKPVQPTQLIDKTIDPMSLNCLAENIYFEASTQSLAGKMAVGFVVLNRVNSPLYPKTICGVVKQRSNNGCQFSWVCNQKTLISYNSNSWKQSKSIAIKLLNNKNIDITEGSTYYHNIHVNPNWNKKFVYVTRIDSHLFYKDS